MAKRKAAGRTRGGRKTAAKKRAPARKTARARRPAPKRKAAPTRAKKPAKPAAKRRVVAKKPVRKSAKKAARKVVARPAASPAARKRAAAAAIPLLRKPPGLDRERRIVSDEDDYVVALKIHSEDAAGAGVPTSLDAGFPGLALDTRTDADDILQDTQYHGLQIMAIAYGAVDLAGNGGTFAGGACCRTPSFGRSTPAKFLR